MHKLIIEYVLDGKRPGYNFRPPTDGFDDATLKAVWRSAMPRGQGWGTDSFLGSRSVKTFPIDRSRMAVSEVLVTGQQDEQGRRGIRRAEITVMNHSAYLAHLQARLKHYPKPVQDAAERRLNRFVWRRIVDRALLRSGQQIVLAHPYRHADDWQLVEALILHLVTSKRMRLIEGWGFTSPFTTLALDHRDESRIVALPLDKTGKIRKASVIRLN
jgi:hypothetical protein